MIVCVRAQRERNSGLSNIRINLFHHLSYLVYNQVKSMNIHYWKHDIIPFMYWLGYFTSSVNCSQLFWSHCHWPTHTHNSNSKQVQYCCCWCYGDSCVISTHTYLEQRIWICICNWKGVKNNKLGLYCSCCHGKRTKCVIHFVRGCT